MAKKDNLPLKVENAESKSAITYAPEVVAIIAGVACNEVEGIASMCNVNTGILGKNRNITRGVRVEVGTEEVSCDLYVNIEYGRPIHKVAIEAQESVRKAIEDLTSLHVVRVDVHVQGVSFEKENSAITAGAQKAVLSQEDVGKVEAPAEQAVTEEQVVAETVEAAADEAVVTEAAPEAAEPAAEGEEQVAEATDAAEAAEEATEETEEKTEA